MYITKDAVLPKKGHTSWGKVPFMNFDGPVYLRVRHKLIGMRLIKNTNENNKESYIRENRNVSQT